MGFGQIARVVTGNSLCHCSYCDCFEAAIPAAPLSKVRSSGVAECKFYYGVDPG